MLIHPWTSALIAVARSVRALSDQRMQPPGADHPPDALTLVVADRREEADERAVSLAPG